MQDNSEMFIQTERRIVYHISWNEHHVEKSFKQKL